MRNVVLHVSEEMTSVPYARENGVLPVRMRFVVRYAQSTPCSFPTYLPFTLPTLAHAINDYAIADLGLAVTLLISVWPLPTLAYAIENYLEQKFATCLLTKLVPLSRDNV